jgi:hypothetical protein
MTRNPVMSQLQVIAGLRKLLIIGRMWLEIFTRRGTTLRFPSTGRASNPLGFLPH